MPHNHAFFHHSLFIENRLRLLTYHLTQRLLRYFRIIRRMGIAPGRLRIHIFKICQIDIHNPLQSPQCLWLLIPSAVIDYRKRQTAVSGLRHRLHNLRRIMGRGHKIDIGRSLLLKFQKNLGQPLHRNLFSRPSPGNIPVLTVDAAKRTAAEKHCPGPLRARNAGLLPHMKRRPGGLDLCSPHTAIAFLTCGAVRAAAAGA